jgi:hypothetical protein
MQFLVDMSSPRTSGEHSVTTGDILTAKVDAIFSGIYMLLPDSGGAFG